MIKKYHNHTPQTNPRHIDEATEHWLSQDIRMTVNVKQPALYSPDLFPINMIAKQEGHKVPNSKTMTKHRTPTNNGSNNKQYINQQQLNLRLSTDIKFVIIF